MNFLAIIAWVVAGILCVAGLVAVSIVLHLWVSFRKAMKAGFNPYATCPGHFTLRIAGDQDAGASAGDTRAPFEPLGILKMVSEGDELKLVVRMAADRSACSVRVSSDSHGEWTVAHTLRADGRLATWTNPFHRFHAAWTPGAETVHWPGGEEDIVIDAACQAAAPDGRRFPGDIGAFRDLYLREMVATWSERYLGHCAGFDWSDLTILPIEDCGQELDPESAFAAVAPVKLAELCATRFIYDSSEPAGRWSAVRERLLFAHEKLDLRQLADADHWSEFLHVTDDLEKALGKSESSADPLADLEIINDRLNPEHRYTRFAGFSEPLRGIVYVAPAEEPEAGLL